MARQRITPAAVKVLVVLACVAVRETAATVLLRTGHHLLRACPSGGGMQIFGVSMYNKATASGTNLESTARTWENVSTAATPFSSATSCDPEVLANASPSTSVHPPCVCAARECAMNTRRCAVDTRAGMSRACASMSLAVSAHRLSVTAHSAQCAHLYSAC